MEAPNQALMKDRGLPRKLSPPDEGPDLELLIRRVPRRGPAAFTLEIHAADAALGINHRSFGPVELKREPAKYIKDLFEEVENLPPERRSEQALEDIGATLFEKLVPQALGELLWSLRGKAATLLIQSDEPWIPWELLRLSGQRADGTVTAGQFLCEAFAVCRWLRGRDQHPWLPLRRLAIVAPQDSALKCVGEELDALHGLLGAGHRAERIAAQLEPVREALTAGNHDGWHFSGHGVAADDPDQGEILLEGTTSLRPRILDGDARNLGRRRPLVFLNACHSGRGGMSLTGCGGWAEQFVKAGAGAFIGTWWAIADDKAPLFASTFYAAFLAGTPIAEAFRQARLAIRTPGDPSWLAYTLFAHPLARCREPPTGMMPPIPDESAAVEPKPSPASEEQPGPGAQRVRRQRASGAGWRRFLWAGCGLAIGLLSLAGAFFVRPPARVQLDLIVDRLAFTVGGEDRQALVDVPLAFRSLTLARFGRLELYPRELAVAGDGAGDRWQAVAPAGSVVVTAERAGSQVYLEPQEAVGRLEPVWAEPATRVVLETHRGAGGGVELTLRLSPAERLSASLPGGFRLTAESVHVAGFGEAWPGPDVVLRGRSDPDRPFIDLSGSAGGLILAASLPSAAVATPLLDRELPITEIEFLKPGREVLTALRRDGRLSYPDHPGLEPILVRAEDFVVLEVLDAFRLRKIAIDPESAGLRLLADGIAGGVRAGPRGLARDYRLSLFRILQGPWWAWVVGWLAAGVTLAGGLEKVWKRRTAAAHRGQAGA